MNYAGKSEELTWLPGFWFECCSLRWYIEKESQGLKIRRNSSVLDIKLKVPMGHPFSDDQHAFGHVFGNDQDTCGG